MPLDQRGERVCLRGRIGSVGGDGQRGRRGKRSSPFPGAISSRSRLGTTPAVAASDSSMDRLRASRLRTGRTRSPGMCPASSCLLLRPRPGVSPRRREWGPARRLRLVRALRRPSRRPPGHLIRSPIGCPASPLLPPSGGKRMWKPSAPCSAVFRQAWALPRLWRRLLPGGRRRLPQ